jgi:hypothetical protein
VKNLHVTETDKYYASLDEPREDGFIPVKCTSLVQFFRLEGKKSIISKENLVPITYIQYVYFSPAEERYYLRVFSNYSCGHLVLYKPLNLAEENISIEQLREKVVNGYGVWLLFNAQQIKDMNEMLIRVFNANRSDKGKLGYKDWITLVETTLKYNDYLEYGKNLTGFATVCNQFKLQLADFWKNAVSNSK